MNKQKYTIKGNRTKSGRQLYWSDEYGWSTRAKATRYTREEAILAAHAPDGKHASL